MRRTSRMLAALAMAGSLPLFVGSVAAAPTGQPLALKNAEMSVVEQAQFRRRGWRGGRWIGPAVGGFAAGVAIGSVLANPRVYDDGYYAYGAAPGYVEPGYVAPGYAVAPRFRTSPQYGSCTGDRYSDSGYPSWACR